MIASLHLLRYGPGAAQAELGRALRHAPDQARPVFLAPLNELPFPLVSFTSFGLLGMWPDREAEEAFAARAPLARHWADTASERWRLVLQAHKSHGTWNGRDPLPDVGREGAPEGPVVVLTSGRLNARGVVPFWRNNPTAVRHLREQQPGTVWRTGWAADVRDVGTLSVWRSLKDATRFAYGEGGHKPQIRALREGGWMSETWFARFAPLASEGAWNGVDPLAPVAV